MTVKKKKFFQSRDRRVPKHFAGAKAAAKKQVKAPHWKASPSAKVESVFSYIQKYAPPEDHVHILLDTYNGRFRIINSSLQWKSISYTKRGFKEASAEVLHQAWSYYQEETGLQPPFPLTELVADFDGE